MDLFLGQVRRFVNGYVILALALLVAGIILLVADVPAVVLTWETASEVGTAGFNVFRRPAGEAASDDAAGNRHQWTQVNHELIPAKGDEIVGATYTYEDEGLVPGRRYRYQIEEVEWDGSTTRYPDEVVVRAGLPPLWTKLEGGVLVLLAAFFIWRRARAL
ncbi:MAG: hypothetical protein JXC32_02350 [Anaerolineae bacterium]|nr:hypothetical protein [Anaerolineae bacterium]